MRTVVDHHVDRLGVEAWQHVKLTSTNRSIGLIYSYADKHRVLICSQSCLCHYKLISLVWWLWRGARTRSHPELGRENPQRRWYFVLRRGRVGRCQAKEVSLFSFMKVSFLPESEHKFRAADINAGWSSPVARQAHNLKVAGSNPAPATNNFNDLTFFSPGQLSHR